MASVSRSYVTLAPGASGASGAATGTAAQPNNVLPSTPDPNWVALADRIARQRRLDASNAKQYRKKVLVHAFQSEKAPTFGQEVGRKGDYILVNCSPDDASHRPLDVYPVDPRVFADTYEEVPGRPHVYRKRQPVWAARLEAACELLTREGNMRANQGDWLVQNPIPENEQRNYGRYQYPVAHEVFKATYEPPEGGGTDAAAREDVAGPNVAEVASGGGAAGAAKPAGALHLSLAAAAAGVLVGFSLARLLHARGAS